jgi:hypothetical protein
MPNSLTSRFNALKSRTVRFFAVITPSVYALIEAGREQIDLIKDYLPEDWSKYLLLVVIGGGLWLRAKTDKPLSAYKDDAK